MKTSLSKQLSLAICLFLLVAVGGSFLITLNNARDQLRLQLGSHAQDSATALGLSLAPHINDPAMVDLMLGAIFDSGHFSRIDVSSLENGQTLAGRSRITADGSAPDWFTHLADIQPQSASATIMHGWQQAAQVEVTSHPQAALDSFWRSAVSILAWLCLCAIISGVLCARLLKRQLQPLRAVVRQAQAISRREYITSDIPSATELQPVVMAMNQMVEQLQAFFTQEAARTEEYRHQAFHDPLTGLPNRIAFGHALAAALTEEAAEGQVFGVQLRNLEAINQRFGAQRADALLQLIAGTLKRCQTDNPGWLCSRSRGGEFLILAPGSSLAETQPLTDELSALIADLPVQTFPDTDPVALGVAVYQTGDSVQGVMNRVAQALTESQYLGKRIRPGHILAATAPAQAVMTNHDWQVRLQTAIAQKQLQAWFQPVFRVAGERDIIHHKLLVRLAESGGGTLPAARFLPWITRLGLAEPFDLCVLELAAQHLAEHPQPLAISVTAQTLASAPARQRFCNALAQYTAAKGLLTVEVDARQHADASALLQFARDLRQAGGRLALQHFGHAPALLGELQLAGLHYLKVDSSFSRNLDIEPEKQLYLDMLLRMVSHLQLPIIAEQVQGAGEMKALEALGFSGMQGHALAEPATMPLAGTPVSG